MAQSSRPDWYRGKQTKPMGDYFGSVSSIAAGESYVTFDRKYIVYRDLQDQFHVSYNACAHAGAELLSITGLQHHKEIRCPLHQWQYAPSGTLLSAPFFERCEAVKRLAVPEWGMWNGYALGYKQSDLDTALAGFGASLGVPTKAFNPGEFEFMEEAEYEMPYPATLMMVNYMDGLHVYRYHLRTFNAAADVSKYLWELSLPSDTNPVAYSIQKVLARSDVRAHMEQLKRQDETLNEEDLGWARLQLWLEEVVPQYGIEYPIDKDIFSLWGAVYGKAQLMPELYLGGFFLAVSDLVHVDPDNPETGHKNYVEYYVHKAIPAELRSQAYRLFRKAYEQSAREDDEICGRLWAAHKRSTDFQRVYHTELEKGDVHFRDWFLKHFAE